MSLKTSFGEVLLSTIDESLSVLGEEPKMALYQYLETMHSLPREDIPHRIEEFSNGLKKALGGASSVVERLILKKLFQRIGGVFREAQGLEFHDYVMEARRRFDLAAHRQTSVEQIGDYGRSKKGQTPS